MKKFWMLLLLLGVYACPAPSQVTVRFVWMKAQYADSYTIQVSKDSTFTTTFLSNDISDTTAVFAGFQRDTKYYWRVSASNITGTSPWSEVWWFTTAPALPSAVLLVLPLRGAIVR